MEKYEKIRIIGRGASGTVYLCNRISDNHRFIIKEIPVDQMTKDERQASLNEAKVLSMLDHPNIVAYHENFLSDNTMVIVMEYVEGGTLYTYLQEREGSLLSEEEAMRFFVQLVFALQCVHTRLILHRDLKSQNILLNKDKTIAKIGDFGISKILSSKSKACTVVGTPYYISPELCEGKPYNQKSDIWALGCILYELLTLKRPFEGDNLPALVMKIMQGNFDPIPDMYSRNVKQLVMSMLHLDPSKRPTACQIMAQPFMVAILYNLYLNFGCVPCNSRSRILNRDEDDLDQTLVSNSSEGTLESSCKVWFVEDGQKDPVLLHLPSAGSSLKCVSFGGEQKIGVTDSGHIIVWKKEKTSINFVPFIIEEKFAFDVTSVTCGDEFAVCLSRTGVVSVWGESSSGCLAHDCAGRVSQPKIVEALFGFNIISIACGRRHGLAVTEDHNVFAWGHGDKGCLGLGKAAFHVSPKLVNISQKQKVIKVFCGTDCSFALTEEKLLLACGSNRHNKLAMDTEDGLHSDDVRVFIPVRSDPLPSLRVQFVASGLSHTAVLTEEGKVYTVGCNRSGQLGWSEVLLSHNMPGLVATVSAFTVTQVACGDHFTLALTKDGSLFAWGKCPEPLQGSYDHMTVRKIDDSIPFLSAQRVAFVSAFESNCAVVCEPKS